MFSGDQIVVKEATWLRHEIYKLSHFPISVKVAWERWVLFPSQQSIPSLFTNAADAIRFLKDLCKSSDVIFIPIRGIDHGGHPAAPRSAPFRVAIERRTPEVINKRFASNLKDLSRRGLR